MKNAGSAAALRLQKKKVWLGWVLATVFLFFASESFSGSLIATWNPNKEEDLAGYKIYYGTESGKYTVEKDVGNQTVFVADNLTDGQTYYFVVKAYDFAGNLSGPSQEVSGVPGKPILVALYQPNGIKLVWTPIAEAQSYQVYKVDKPYEPNGTLAATLTSAEKEYFDQDYKESSGKECYYYVRALKNGQPVYQFDRVGAYSFNLKTGLNLVSLPLVPADSTVQAVFGDQLTGGEGSPQADQLRLWKGDQYYTVWYYKGPAAPQGKWVDAATGLESKQVIDPNIAFWVKIQKGHKDSLVTVTGKVPVDSNRVIRLAKGFNFVGSCYPTVVSLKNTELYQDGVVKGGLGSGNSDIVRAWADSAYVSAWVVDGTGGPLDGTWMDQSGKKETSIQFRPGAGYVIWIKGDRPNTVWTYPNPLYKKE